MSLFNGVGSNLEYSGTPPPQLDIDKIIGDTILKAIYEIGLEVIGENEPTDFTHEYKGKTVASAENITNSARNDLRAAQRKAWAKACGVKDE